MAVGADSISVPFDVRPIRHNGSAKKKHGGGKGQRGDVLLGMFLSAHLPPKLKNYSIGNVITRVWKVSVKIRGASFNCW